MSTPNDLNELLVEHDDVDQVIVGDRVTIVLSGYSGQSFHYANQRKLLLIHSLSHHWAPVDNGSFLRHIDTDT